MGGELQTAGPIRRDLHRPIWSVKDARRPPGSVQKMNSRGERKAPRARTGRLRPLHWSDMDFDNRVLHVRHQTERRRGTLYDDYPKSRRSGVIPMPALCIAPLRWHRPRQRETFAASGVAWSEGGYIFATGDGWPVQSRNVYRSFTRDASAAGLRVVRLHDARHGCATLLTAAGVAPGSVWRSSRTVRPASRRTSRQASCMTPNVKRSATWTGCSSGLCRASEGRLSQTLPSKAPDHDRSGAFPWCPRQDSNLRHPL